MAHPGHKIALGRIGQFGRLIGLLQDLMRLFLFPHTCGHILRHVQGGSGAPSFSVRQDHGRAYPAFFHVIVPAVQLPVLHRRKRMFRRQLPRQSLKIKGLQIFFPVLRMHEGFRVSVYPLCIISFTAQDLPHFPALAHSLKRVFFQVDIIRSKKQTAQTADDRRPPSLLQRSPFFPEFLFCSVSAEDIDKHLPFLTEEKDMLLHPHGLAAFYTVLADLFLRLLHIFCPSAQIRKPKSIQKAFPVRLVYDAFGRPLNVIVIIPGIHPARPLRLIEIHPVAHPRIQMHHSHNLISGTHHCRQTLQILPAVFPLSGTLLILPAVFPLSGNRFVVLSPHCFFSS